MTNTAAVQQLQHQAREWCDEFESVLWSAAQALGYDLHMGRPMIVFTECVAQQADSGAASTRHATDTPVIDWGFHGLVVPCAASEPVDAPPEETR
jgi:hypothetical protein